MKRYDVPLIRAGLLALILAGLPCASSIVTAGTTETVLYAFQGGSDGAYPEAALVADNAGHLYGTTSAGGTGSCQAGCGSVFELTPPSAPGGVWTEAVLYRFSGGGDGAAPIAGLVFDRAGALYGTTSSGGIRGNGTAFKLTPPSEPGGAWTQTVLYSFRGSRANDGANPEGTLVFDNNGNLYGTTYAGGIACSDSAPTGCGTIFELTPPSAPGGTWSEKVLYRFDPSFAGAPVAGLIFDAAGNLYGTAVNDGTNGEGTAYRLSPMTGGAWGRTVLHTFGGSNDGGYVYAGLVFGQAGALYGATTGYGGGVGNGGVVFRLTVPAVPGNAWSETILYMFPGKNGYTEGPFGRLLADKTGALYGTTGSGGGGQCSLGGWLGCGIIFKLTPSATGGAWAETTLHDFSGGQDGGVSYAGLIFGPDHALYGTTYGGGGGRCSKVGLAGCGTIVTVMP